MVEPVDQNRPLSALVRRGFIPELAPGPDHQTVARTAVFYDRFVDPDSFFDQNAGLDGRMLVWMRR
jgi:hypothetical protein